MILENEGQQIKVEAQPDGNFLISYGDDLWFAKKGKIEHHAHVSDTWEQSKAWGDKMVSDFFMPVAETLYRIQNPTSKMDTPNAAYELTKKWYGEFLMDIKKEDVHFEHTHMGFLNWCLKHKR